MHKVVSTMGALSNRTCAITLSDTSAMLTALVDTALSASISWEGTNAAMITVETADCRVAFGVAASTSLGHIVAAGQSIRITSPDMISEVRVINATAGSNAVLQITLETGGG